MNNADLIIATLKANGVTRGFGIPSGNVLPLMEAMRQGGVEFVLTAHEGSAGFAADVTGRMTGAPGLCIATLGPGATNLATGVGGAFLDRSPLIAITCNLNTEQLGRRIQMWIDHHALFKPITKATLKLEPGCVAETMTQAITLALSEPKGPVHLDLPEDVALAATNEELAPPAQAGKLATAPDTALARAAELIAAAKRPIAVLGATAMRVADPQLLRNVIERHNLPFATTTMAKGMIDEDHPLSLGCIERACRQVQRKFLRSADLIVGLGYDTVEVEYEAWIGDRPLLQIDIEPVDLAPSVNLVHQVSGDFDASLARLNALPAAANEWNGATIAEHRRRFHAALRPAAKSFTAHAAIDAVRRALPREGAHRLRRRRAHAHQIASQWSAHAPKTFHITNGWSSMGFGLPGAIAAKLARPEAPVVCLLGDGCFQMTCGEVATAKRLGIALPVVVARRPLARAHQGETDSASVPALRHRAAGGSLPRTAGALFRRARGRRQHCRRARGCGQDGTGGKRTDGDRGRGRFRALHRHSLRLSHSIYAPLPTPVRHGAQPRRSIRKSMKTLTLGA
jgi:acetolactate synthase I/II/III large subunit